MPLFLGIDGGGTKTRCLLGDENSVLAAGIGAGCNLLRVGEACARDSLAGAIHEACVKSGVSPQQIARTCAGISGAADDGIASLMQRLLIEIIGGAIEVIGDMEIAMESAFGGGPGVIVISGTGSIAYGRNSRGETARAGGWGRVISDEGAGHWIAVHALASAMRARDEGRHSELLQVLMAALDVHNPEDLVVHVNEDPVRDYARLFPAVLNCAESGDADAKGVLVGAGAELAKLAQLVIRRLFGRNENVPVATHGGVFASSPTVRESFEQELQSLCPGVDCSARQVDPAMGALARARREFGVWHRH